MQEHYANTADYIERKLLGKPKGYPVWLKFSDCTAVYELLKEAVDNGRDDLKSLHDRFSTQYKPKD
jgi:hypothetical protein